MKVCEENQHENQSRPEFNKVVELASWSYIAKEMMIDHALGRRWSGSTVAGFNHFVDQLERKRNA